MTSAILCRYARIMQLKCIIARLKLGFRMLKRERQKKLLSLIRAKPIGTQEALKAHLERAGVPATQSSASRDLDELGVIKQHGRYTQARPNGAAAHGLLSLDLAGDILVVARTEPGLASAVAVD